jgi:glucose-1-phosphatase
MNSPEVVVFDLGKVFVDFDWNTAARKIAAHCALQHTEISERCLTASVFQQFETGLVDSETFYKEIKSLIEYQENFEQFAIDFGDIFTPIPAMIDLNRKLRAQAIPTYIFSNTNPISIDYIRQQFAFFAEFTDYVFSYEHKAMKPHASLYKVVEKVTGSQGHDILFVDDNYDNVQAGIDLGWLAVQHGSPQTTHSALAKYYAI